MREIGRLVLVLTLICGISAAALTAARQSLGPRIEQQNDLYVRGPALERLFELPASELLGRKVNVPLEDETVPVFYLEENGEVAFLALEAAGKGGYGGDIVVMIGIDLRNDQMVGIEIIQHNETPGVGSKVEKETFRNQWKKIPADETVDLRTQGGRIDAISGATYSSKAMVSGTNRIVEILDKHRDEILAAIEKKE
jgi:electron transport complex protein RnfG